MTNLTIRIDENVKKEAENLFDKLGMSISGAINVFFRQAIREQAIPFMIRTKSEEERYNDYFNPHNMKILMESVAQAERGETISFTMEELKDMENGEVPQRALDFLKTHSKQGNGNG